MSNLPGADGGAWTEEEHRALYPDTFNTGLAAWLVETIQPASVLEFGSGLGHMAQYMHDAGALVHCIEPNMTKYAGPTLFAVDIFKDPIPTALERKYDLVLSIEVAEHVPLWQHSMLFDFLYARSGRWIVFSGARPGQEGHGHIACRAEEDWRGEWTRRGAIFMSDLTADARAHCNARNVNHVRNMQVFEKP